MSDTDNLLAGAPVFRGDLERLRTEMEVRFLNAERERSTLAQQAFDAILGTRDDLRKLDERISALERERDQLRIAVKDLLMVCAGLSAATGNDLWAGVMSNMSRRYNLFIEDEKRAQE